MPKSAALVVLLAAVAAASAQHVPYEKVTLANGMRVIYHEDHALPVATVNLWFHVGSKDEPARRSGFAHLFEHLMFMGTRRAPAGQFDQIMESGGGNNNASTSQDRTNYYDYGPSSLLPTLLWLEADRLEDLGRMMDQHKLNLQREVVKNERRENFENAPYGMVSIKLSEAMYPEGHPYHVDTIGLPEDLDAATVGDVRDFFSTYYVPNNATMVVAGDFDPKTIKPLVARLFGTLPRGNDPIHRTVAQAQLHKVERITLVDKVPLARTHMAWHSPAYYAPGDAEMDLAAGILSYGIGSRLYQRLVVRDGLASDVAATQGSQLLGSLFTIEATAKQDVPLDKLESAIDDELARFVKDGPSQSELEREKAKWQFATLSSLESLGEVADRLNQYDFYLGEPDSFQFDLERHTKLTPVEVRDRARKVLDPDSRLILRVVPLAAAPKQNPRDVRPKPSPPRAVTFPEPRRTALANGMKLVYFQRPNLPLMSLSAEFRAGSNIDPAGKSGLASLTAAMLDQGAGDLDAAAFGRRLDDLGARFSAGAGVLTSDVALSVTSANFAKAVPLFAEAIIRPRFDREAFEREKGLRLDELAQAAEDPESVARDVAQSRFFGESHPYGRNPLGSRKSVPTLTLEDVRRTHDQVYQPRLATIVAAGSLPIEEVEAHLNAAFANWRPPDISFSIPKATLPSPTGLKVVVVDRPGAVQTVIRFVFPGTAYRDSNRVALEGVNAVLGGMFTSRLNADLREAKGYTYGAGSRLVFDPELGYQVASSAVRADVTGAALAAFLEQFRKLHSRDLSEAEAAKARASLRTDLIASMESLNGLIATAQELLLNGRTMADLARDLQALGKLRAAELNARAGEIAPLQRGLIVLVGDKGRILKQIAPLRLPKPLIAG